MAEQEDRPSIRPVFRIPGVVLPDRSRSQVLLIEMVVVLVIVAILMSILVPAFRSSRATARGAVCLDKLRRLGQMMTMYAQDFDEHFPPLPPGRSLEHAARSVVRPPLAWTVRLAPYREPEERDDPFVCPAADAPTYAYNAALGARVFPRYDPKSGPISLAGVSRPSETFLVFDTANRVAGANALSGARFFYGAPGQPAFRPGDFVLPTVGVREDWVRPRHNGSTNVVYCDGHVRRVDDPAIRLEAHNPFDPAAAE